jgi:hypothetical protein
MLSEEQKKKIITELMMGKTLTSICRGKNMPSLTTVYHGTREDEDFKKDLKEARMHGALTRLDESQDQIEEYQRRKDLTHVEVTLLRDILHNNRWYASKLIPAFNDKVVNEHKGEINHVVVKWKDDSNLKEVQSSHAYAISGTSAEDTDHPTDQSLKSIGNSTESTSLDG